MKCTKAATHVKFINLIRSSKRLKGSYSIEAVYIMAITFFTFATVIGAAYRLKDRTVKAMELHARIEILRYQEDGVSDSVCESTGGTDWFLEIAASVPNPEDWLRLISLTER